MGVPKESPPGINKKDYVLLSIVSKEVAPDWAEEDFFTV